MGKYYVETIKAYKDKVEFGGNREIAIQRDGEACVKCGMTRDQHYDKYGRDITVDHIDNNGTNKPQHLKNNSLSNLQTLCLECHGHKDNKLTDVQAINIYHVRDVRGAGIKLCRAYDVYKGNAWQIQHGFSWSAVTGAPYVPRYSNRLDQTNDNDTKGR